MAVAKTGRFDWSQMTAAPTALLETIDNPLHVAIVQNYRRHYMLENGLRWKEIFDPTMTVSAPDYHMSSSGFVAQIHGDNAVYDMYSQIYFQIFPEWEDLAVADWGIASESYVHQYTNGAALTAMGKPGFDDPDARYDMKYQLGMFWRYNDKGLLVGEHVYSQDWTIEIEELPPGEPDADDVAKILHPIVESQEAEWRASLLV